MLFPALASPVGWSLTVGTSDRQTGQRIRPDAPLRARLTPMRRNDVGVIHHGQGLALRAACKWALTRSGSIEEQALQRRPGN